MNRNTAALIAAGLSTAFVVLTVVHVTHGTFDDELTTTADYLNDGSFTAALLLLIPGLTALRDGRDTPKWALQGAILGALLVATGVIAGLIAGESPSWFAAVGAPGVLLLLVNTGRIGRAMWREAEWPRWVAVAIGLTVPAGIILAETGGSALPALTWAYLAGRFATAERPEPARA